MSNFILGNDDFFFEDFHGVVGAARLLPHQNDFTKSAFAQKLQIVKVIHCLSFVVANGGVHLLLVDVFNLGGGAAQDALLLLLG